MKLNASSKRNKLIVLVSLWLALLLASIAVPVQAAGPNRWPNSMASTGDSITRAFNTGTVWFTDATWNSWSTGTNRSVDSHYLRILANNHRILGKHYNDARSGAKMIDLNSQINRVVWQKVDYVTILMGANDICTSSEDTMTPTATFTAQFQQAMTNLTKGLPKARIFVASIPDIYHLWDILHTNYQAVFTWDIFSICQSMLANPTSTYQGDVDRRARVRQHNIELNAQLADVCAHYTLCRFDNNAVFNTAFTTSDVSTIDYFHPSLNGQAKLAGVSWTATMAGFNFGG
jgi:lysophospholipase L1-like esterase